MRCNRDNGLKGKLVHKILTGLVWQKYGRAHKCVLRSKIGISLISGQLRSHRSRLSQVCQSSEASIEVFEGK
jgi:hypothetical protein